MKNFPINSGIGEELNGKTTEAAKRQMRGKEAACGKTAGTAAAGRQKKAEEDARRKSAEAAAAGRQKKAKEDTRRKSAEAAAAEQQRKVLEFARGKSEIGRGQSSKENATRISELGGMIVKTEKALACAPQGTLIVRHPRGRAQFYQKSDEKPRREVYISKKKNADLICKLAQKDYDQKVLKLMKLQKREMERYGKNFPCGSLDDVFDSLDDDRKALVTPIELTTAQYEKIWIEASYPESQFPIDPQKPNYTDRGEPVRSKSEVIIANALNRAGISYKYECPLNLRGGTVRPDFTILNRSTRREIYLEHFGMMDNPEYVNGFLRKIVLYEANNIYMGERLICTFESSAQSLDTRMLKKMITHYFS